MDAKEIKRLVKQYVEGNNLRIEVEFIGRGNEIKRIIITKKEGNVIEEEKKEVKYEEIENEITKILHDMGIPPHIKGFRYIRESVMMGYKDIRILNFITNKLYPSVAKKYQTTPIRVERAIRHAIEVTWEKGNKEGIEEIFGYRYSGKRPTNSEFIAMIVDYLNYR